MRGQLLPVLSQLAHLHLEDKLHLGAVEYLDHQYYSHLSRQYLIPCLLHHYSYLELVLVALLLLFLVLLLLLVYRYSQDECISCFVLLVLVCHQIHFLWHFVCLSEW